MRERSGNGWGCWAYFLLVAGSILLVVSCSGGDGGSTPPPQGSVLTVDAGPDQVVLYDNQSPIQLDGSSCSDSEGLPLIYSWAFALLPQGSGAVITGADTENPTFQPDMIGTYEVELMVSNGVEAKTDSVRIDAAGNLDATADAGADQAVNRGTATSLNGSGSEPGPGATIITWQWIQVLGPDVTAGAGNLTGETPSFTAPNAVATLAFDLRVDDGTGLSPADRIRVQVMADTANALFVDPASGDDASPGTRDEPMASLSATIQKAHLDALGADIYLNGDIYETATITLRDGISIYGGFDSDWRRHEWLKTRIDVATPTAFYGENLTAETELDQLSIRSGDGNNGQPSTVGVHLQASDAVQIRNTTVIAGNGYDGANGGSIGEPALDGDDGSIGNMGCEHGGLGCDTCIRPEGGEGGNTYAMGWGPVRGGDGGYGERGSGEGNSGSSGWSIPGTPEAAGGPGTPMGQGDWNTPSTYWGENGNHGADGANGSPGLEIYTLTGYVPANGADGADGVPGNGGGGGGGGGGGTDGCDSYGGSGGGGGAGGLGGDGGGGGASGGASIAVYASNCPALSLDNCILLTGSGGDGGDGGDGQPGGNGGDGGRYARTGQGNVYGGSEEQGDGSNGGRGGDGGDGGRGGDGGGGHGGPAIGILQYNATITTNQLSFYIGAAGLGGSSSGNSGSNGRREEVYSP